MVLTPSGLVQQSECWSGIGFLHAYRAQGIIEVVIETPYDFSVPQCAWSVSDFWQSAYKWSHKTAINHISTHICIFHSNMCRWWDKQWCLHICAHVDVTVYFTSSHVLSTGCFSSVTSNHILIALIGQHFKPFFSPSLSPSLLSLLFILFDKPVAKQLPWPIIK